ncbi:MAG: T9SS type B sorting domain-containing protein [Gilvibacter sp.]
MRTALLILLLTLGAMAQAQECPLLTGPTAGATNVPVDTSISWDEVIGVTGYVISIGTSPGAGDIVSNQPVGSDTSFTPPLGLPESTQIYVTITLFFFDQPDIDCPSIAFTTRNETNPPDCTAISSPINGAIDVNVGANISWSYAPRATGYRIILGTAPGLGDIENNLDVGNTLSFNPAADFPPATQIYVRVIPYNENGNALGCSEESFTTGDLGDPPGCTMLITPLDGAINVALSPFIEWVAVPGATGYIVNIGRSPFVNDILDGGVFFTNSTFVLNFEPNNTYFITIIPFNDAGQAQDCGQESFSTIRGCGPFFDPDTGELVDLYPVLLLPDVLGICENELPTRINSPDTADGFRWYQITATGDELLLSEESFVDIAEEGLYRYEAYIITDQAGIEIECSSTKEFTVVSSELATIDFLRIEEIDRLFSVEAQVSGAGDYEFSLSPDGPYQDVPIFTGLEEGSYIMYVRDKNGCGIAQRAFRLAFPPTGFPPYFSPNGDGINDFWQYVPPLEDPLQIVNIAVFDRYGKLLASFPANSVGWNGRYNNNPLPASGYWYKAQTLDGAMYSGFFSLVR